ncbi:unnamed protein product [Cuscuta europaea]|uniref:Uncharacterized protein n=1 Tax=Cuscuta europaea TaxID=41803 RepID=A0A9P1EHE7_CUSEU|nr:unnamed protein product [Cuscuta europaea]
MFNLIGSLVFKVSHLFIGLPISPFVGVGVLVHRASIFSGAGATAVKRSEAFVEKRRYLRNWKISMAHLEKQYGNLNVEDDEKELTFDMVDSDADHVAKLAVEWIVTGSVSVLDQAALVGRSDGSGVSIHPYYKRSSSPEQWRSCFVLKYSQEHPK